MSDIQTDMAALRSKLVDACREFEKKYPAHHIHASYTSSRFVNTDMSGNFKVYAGNPAVDVHATISDFG